MSYFKRFPKISYEYKTGVFKKSIDILKRVGLTEKISKNAAYWYEHEVKENETPESIANRLYGDPKQYWLILLANEILNPSYEWPLPSDKLYDRIVKKYDGMYLFGVDGPNAESLFEEGHFRNGDKLYINQGDEELAQSTITGIVDSYDKTYQVCVLKNTTGSWPTILSGGNDQPIGFKNSPKYTSYFPASTS